MKKIAYLILVCIAILSCENDAMTPVSDVPTVVGFYKGMDLSFLSQIESQAVVFKDENNLDITDNYAYLASRGVNLIRIRLWIDNSDGLYNLNFVKAQALRAQANGMEFLLDFHYSNTWADPSAQNIPAIWANQDVNQLSQRIKDYSQNVVQELVLQGTSPAIVQIGNETDNGMLWPVGQVYLNGNAQWDNYVRLTKAAIEGIKQASPDSKIMIHKSGVIGADYFYEQLITRNVDFDIAGLSYYPWWHNTDLNLIETELQQFAAGISQKVMIVETAYPFTLNWFDNTNNIVGLNNQLVPQYPATLNGQYSFMLRIHNMIKNLPDQQGIGYCYWAPDWVAYDSNATTITNGSSWENMAIFNFNLQVNPAIGVFSF